MSPYAIASILLLAALSACRPKPADPAAAAPPAPSATVAMDRPAGDVPPAAAPETAPAPTAGARDAPPATAPDGDRNLARFDGYGDLRFGTAAERMEQAWGGELETLGKEDNGSCYFMTAVWVRTPAEFHFMIGDDAEVTAWRVGVPPEVDYVEGCS